jgi:hypothetical protein
MKIKLGMTDVVGLPLDEADRIMDGMEQAEKAGDPEALRWCARMIRWLWDQSEVIGADIYSYTGDLFNCAWKGLMARDPPPASIAAIVTPEEKSVEPEFADPPRIANRTDALGLLDQLLETEFVRGMGNALEALRDAIEREII